MKTYNLLISLGCAYLLLAYSFHQTERFWPIFSIALLIMVAWACTQERFAVKRISWVIPLLFSIV